MRKKVKLNVLESLKYQREIVVEIPNNMSEDELNDALDKAQREEFLDDFIFSLGNSGIQCSGFDDDLSSPFYSEVECDDYKFIEGDPK